MAIRGMIVVVGSALLLGCSTPQVVPSGPGLGPTPKGDVLVDARGMTLYTYDKDSGGQSACTEFCSIAWPPAQAAEDARPPKGFSVIRRSNGTGQWAYNGRPLYGYFRDSAPGEVSGDGVDGVWHLARP